MVLSCGGGSHHISGPTLGTSVESTRLENGRSGQEWGAALIQPVEPMWTHSVFILTAVGPAPVPPTDQEMELESGQLDDACVLVHGDIDPAVLKSPLLRLASEPLGDAEIVRLNSQSMECIICLRD